MNDSIDYGPCCACGEPIIGHINILTLKQRAPVPGTGWGCMVCELPVDGAIAILCDECLTAEVKWVVDGMVAEGKRVPIESLDKAPFDHAPALHLQDRAYNDWYDAQASFDDEEEG